MTIHPHRGPERRCKTVDEWPKKDRDLWLAALHPGDVLEDGGERSRFSAVTNRNIAKGYGRWLTWLECCGLLDDRVGPAERITPARVRDYVAALGRNDATGTIIGRLQELTQAAKVMGPQQNWSWIARMAASVRGRHRPARPKRHRLVGIGVLFDLGLTLMILAQRENTDRRRVIAYRDGLLIALLAARPLRLRNLAALALGRNLVRRGEDWWIEICADETKTHEPIEVPWPRRITPQLEHYLSDVRPLLARMRGRWTRPAGEALWLSTDGSPMTAKSIYDRVITRTRAALGRSVNPHLFRDCAATSVALDDPAHVRIASRLLGHRSSSTTERHYNQASAVEASRQVQAFLLSLRQGNVRVLKERF
jgi:integrase/recombinase XerD